MAEDSASNTGLVVLVVVLIAALLVAVFLWMRADGDDVELELDVEGTGWVAPAGSDALTLLAPGGLRTA